MAENKNKLFKTGLILFCIGRGLGISESVALLIYDLIYNFNERFYGYSNLQTVIFLLVSVLLTAAVIVFAAVTKGAEAKGKSAKIPAILLCIAGGILLLYLTYGVVNNLSSDLEVYYGAEIISAMAKTLLLTVISGDLFSIIGGGMLFAFGIKNSKN